MTPGDMIVAYLEDGPIGCGFRGLMVLEADADTVRLFYPPTLTSIEVERRDFDADKSIRPIEYDRPRAQMRMLSGMAERERYGIPFDREDAIKAIDLTVRSAWAAIHKATTR